MLNEVTFGIGNNVPVYILLASCRDQNKLQADALTFSSEQHHVMINEAASRIFSQAIYRSSRLDLEIICVEHEK
jgi:hypothetical protein